MPASEHWHRRTTTPSLCGRRGEQSMDPRRLIEWRQGSYYTCIGGVCRTSRWCSLASLPSPGVHSPPPEPTMASRESEPRQSMGPPQSVKGAQETRKEPNPHTDYRQHFNRTKQRFDAVTAVSLASSEREKGGGEADDNMFHRTRLSAKRSWIELARSSSNCRKSSSEWIAGAQRKEG